MTSKFKAGGIFVANEVKKIIKENKIEAGGDYYKESKKVNETLKIISEYVDYISDSLGIKDK